MPQPHGLPQLCGRCAARAATQGLTPPRPRRLHIAHARHPCRILLRPTEWSTASVMDARFTWADAQQLPTTYRYNRRQARSWFAELQVFLTAHGLSQFDITTQDWANWRRYLAFHPRAREIIGHGVHRFEVRSSGAFDANTQQHRVDFVVRRVDGTVVCLLHPDITWLPEAPASPSPPRASPAPALGRDNGEGLAGGGRVSRAQVMQWVAERLEAWEASLPLLISNPRQLNLWHATMTDIITYNNLHRCTIHIIMACVGSPASTGTVLLGLDWRGPRAVLESHPLLQLVLGARCVYICACLDLWGERAGVPLGARRRR